MSIVFIAGVVITVAFAMVACVRVKRQEKHDRVLFRFCQIRRDLMGELRDRYDSLSAEEFEAAKFLLGSLSGVIRHYHRHKTTMFNVRIMRRVIEKDLKRYQILRQRVQKRLAEVPPGTKVAGLYDDFSRASMLAFFSYTPFMIWEVLLRLLWADLAVQIAQIAQIRREAASAFGEKFA